MKFSKHNYPVLEYVGRGRIPIGKHLTFKSLDLRKELTAHVNLILDSFPNVYYFRPTLTDKIENLFTKLMDDVPTLMELPSFEGHGIFLLNRERQIIFQTFTMEGEKGVMVALVSMGSVSNITHVFKEKDKLRIATVPYNVDHDWNRDADDVFGNFIQRYIFLKYAPIEIRIVNRDTKKGKYKNSSLSPITMVDSRWFTTIIRTKGFGVSGHFRLQPCGRNREDRKLIWIKAFKKHGYHARARKLIPKNQPSLT